MGSDPGENYMATVLPNHLHTATGKLSTGLVSMVGLLGLTLFSPSAFAVSCDFRNGDVFKEICGYIAAGDVQIGGQLKLHVASTTSDFSVHMRRAGNQNSSLQSVSLSGAGNHNPAPNSYNGLNWGSAFSVNIPANWTSGIYEVSLNNGKGDYSEFVAIKSAQPGSHSKVLILDSLPTKALTHPLAVSQCTASIPPMVHHLKFPQNAQQVVVSGRNTVNLSLGSTSKALLTKLLL